MAGSCACWRLKGFGTINRLMGLAQNPIMFAAPSQTCNRSASETSDFRCPIQRIPKRAHSENVENELG